VNPVFSYDADANAAYIRFGTASIVESEEASPGVILDFDAEGHIVGMELLRARDQLPPEYVAKAA
jgi:uncharacterized protein YuzE